MTDDDWSFFSELYRNIARIGVSRGWDRRVIEDEIFREFDSHVPGGLRSFPNIRRRIKELIDQEMAAGGGGPTASSLRSPRGPWGGY